ncbi:MAG: hypothetical protein PUJ80_12050 [Verrucomicrobiota bacterium]|nr:hypothetical protein [Verrucomicrobiota bacterium]
MNNIARVWLAAAFCIVALSPSALAASVYEHGIFESVSLNGEWEMAYRPYAHEVVECPAFRGVKVRNAVPGYWEDMVPELRSSGMADEFRINPLYERQRLPISGSAGDTTLPNIYGCFLYRKSIDLKRVGPAVLAFEGVRNQVHVWINGMFVAYRAGFSTPFELEVKDGVLKVGLNEIVLAVSNNPNLGYCDYVSGLATRSTFASTGGVNGNLELRFPRNGLGDVYVTTSKDLKAFTVHVSGKVPFRYEISDGGKVMAQGEGNGDFTLSSSGYSFWSPESPKRYELSLVTDGGVYRQKFGIRRLAAVGEKFRLNGEPIYLRGVTEHCYFAKTVHLPRDLDYYRMVTRKRKELGFNFVRFHTFVPPAEYLEATDELGMVVHIESPNFVPEPEFASIIAFARRHPSVVIYCTGNETRIDRLAEAYLRDVAELVHTMTDSLFSPMSAMRGVEYMLMPGKDRIVKDPFPHNAERMSRLSRYCDMFTSYQLGLASYESLNLGTSADLDAWGDVYCGKPRTSHEICIDGSYVDFGLEKLYPPDSPILRAGVFSEPRRVLSEKGLIGRADAYFRNSCEWMWRIRKHCFEKLRAADRVAGYDFLGDINTHWHTFGYSVGMMDEFYRLKPGETVENVLRYNSPAVVLSDLGNDFNVVAGDARRVSFAISNYRAEIPAARLDVSLVDCADGKCKWSRSSDVGAIANGTLSRLCAFDVRFPERGDARKYALRASVSGGGMTVENEWEIYAFPKVEGLPAHGGVKVVEDISVDGLAAAMSRGERVLLLGSGPFKALKTTFRIGMAGRCYGNYATVIDAMHPAMRGMPHEGFCGWQFRHMMEGGRAVQLEADVPFDPVIDVASSVKMPIRQAYLFEYRVGEGRLLVCSFRLDEGDPAARWLKAGLVRYAAGPLFNPRHVISAEQLRAVVNAPLLRGSENSNRARNPNDPSSNVRAGAKAQP